MALLSSFALGLLLGVVLHRGDFCMQSALQELVARRPGASLRAYLLALAVQLAFVNALAAVGALRVGPPPVAPVAAGLGGLVFGVGMVLAKG